MMNRIPKFFTKMTADKKRDSDKTIPVLHQRTLRWVAPLGFLLVLIVTCLSNVWQFTQARHIYQVSQEIIDDVVPNAFLLADCERLVNAVIKTRAIDDENVNQETQRTLHQQIKELQININKQFEHEGRLKLLPAFGTTQLKSLGDKFAESVLHEARAGTIETDPNNNSTAGTIEQQAEQIFSVGHVLQQKTVENLFAADEDVDEAIEQQNTVAIYMNIAVVVTIGVIGFWVTQLLRRYHLLIQINAREMASALNRTIEATQAKSRFLAHMSHEIRTPLYGVTGTIDLLITTELSPRQKQLVTMARSSAVSLLSVINDILDLSKIEAGKVELEDSEISLMQFIEDVVDAMQPLASAKKITLATVMGLDVPVKVWGDYTRLRQILTNILSNAIKFTEKGHVIVRLHSCQNEKNESVLRFSVEDTGIGIRADKISRLFAPFSQVDNSTTRRFGGTGLGLAISKQLVELMGGTIGVNSTIGMGTTFWLNLPLRVVTERSPSKESRIFQNLRALRILAIVNNAEERLLLSEQLTAWNPASVVISSRTEASRMLREANDSQKRFNIIIVDADIADTSRAAFINTIVTEWATKGMKLLALVDKAKEVPDLAFTSIGFHGVIGKPLQQSRLFDLIADWHQASDKNELLPVTPLDRSLTRRNLRILLVDDNETNQYITKEMLANAGYTCTVVGDGSAALEMWRKQKFDAILMDCLMPILDGWQTTEKIREEEKNAGGKEHIYIIALTADAMSQDRERCLAVGMDGYVAKPIEFEKLISELDKVPSINPVTSKDDSVQPTEPPIDVPALQKRCMFDAKFVSEVLEDFARRIQTDFRLINEKGSGPDAIRIAHNLGAIASHVGANHLAAILRVIEQQAASGAVESISTSLQSLQDEIQRCADDVPRALAEAAKRE